MIPAERVEVWQDADGRWRWAWVHDDAPPDGDRLELPSSEPALTRDEALAAARQAYPGVLVTDVVDDRAPAAGEDRHRWPWRLATVALTVTLAGFAARYRRWALVVVAPVIAAGAVRRLRRHRP